MHGRRVMRSMAVVAALGVSLAGCLPFRLPIQAVPSPDKPVSSAATPSPAAATPSRTPTPSLTPGAQAAIDPFAGKRVDLTVGYAAPKRTKLPCSSDSPGSYPARAGSYVGFSNDEVAGVFDLATGQWLWCVTNGFGGADGVAEVTSDSAVGRPGYQPSLDADTLEAAEYDSQGMAFFLQAGEETLLVVPVTINRPPIGSQKQAPLRGLVAFDGHGVKKWVTGLPQADAADTFCRKDATACLLEQGSGSKAVVIAPDPASGQLTTVIQGVPLSRNANPGPAGSEVILLESTKSQPMWAGYAAEAEAHLITSDAGQVLKSYGYIGVTDHWVVLADKSKPSASKLWRLDTSTGVNAVVPFAFPKDSCLPLADRQLVCTGSGSDSSIGVFDLTSGNVIWEWREDDPDPVTQVPRKVPDSLDVYGDLIFAEPSSSERYLIDAKTGLDVPFDAKMTAAYELLRTDDCTSYGCVDSSSSGIEYSMVK